MEEKEVLIFLRREKEVLPMIKFKALLLVKRNIKENMIKYTKHDSIIVFLATTFFLLSKIIYYAFLIFILSNSLKSFE